MRIKTRDEIKQNLIRNYNTRLPDLDLTDGTPEQDMFVEAQVEGSLLNIWNEIGYTGKLHAPLTYYPDLEEEDIDNFCATYGVIPRPATRSIGKATFYTYTEPPDTIEIADGIVINTGGAEPIEFEVDGTYRIPYSVRNAYYNATEERWEITCNVRAVKAGTDYRAGTGTVNRLQTVIPGIEGVVNNAPIVGGEATESIPSRISRVVQKFQGRDLGPSSGILNFVGVYASAVNIVGANDPLMERDEGLGGAVDIYIIESDLESTTEQFVITSSGLSLGVNVPYTSTGIILSLQPVDSIISVILNNIVLDPSYYTLTKDTGLLSKSTRASDEVELTSTGISSTGIFTDGDVVEVSYNYNTLLHTIEADLNSSINHYQGRDYLLRNMTPVTIDVYMRFKEVEGQDFDAIASGVELAISDFISRIRNAGSVELADIINVAKAYTGVDNIDTTTTDQTNTGGGHKTAQKDVLLGKNEYPIAGTIYLQRWTNQ